MRKTFFPVVLAVLVGPVSMIERLAVVTVVLGQVAILDGRSLAPGCTGPVQIRLREPDTAWVRPREARDGTG